MGKNSPSTCFFLGVSKKICWTSWCTRVATSPRGREESQILGFSNHQWPYYSTTFQLPQKKTEALPPCHCPQHPTAPSRLSPPFACPPCPGICRTRPGRTAGSCPTSDPPSASFNGGGEDPFRRSHHFLLGPRINGFYLHIGMTPYFIT